MNRFKSFDLLNGVAAMKVTRATAAVGVPYQSDEDESWDPG
ncbi:hypothetical protein [Streptomyces sp. NPDC014894]